MPDPDAATSSATDVAEACAIAANSSSYRDSLAGSWTARARPFVTGTEAADEIHQSGGGGGSWWIQIRAALCVSSLHQLSAVTPDDAPTGPARHVVSAGSRR
jgi:hypothetical protein